MIERLTAPLSLSWAARTVTWGSQYCHRTSTHSSVDLTCGIRFPLNWEGWGLEHRASIRVTAIGSATVTQSVLFAHLRFVGTRFYLNRLGAPPG